MDLQLILALLIVAGAAFYLGRETWRSWRGRQTGCGGGCGCSAAAPAESNGRTLIPLEQIGLRRRDPGAG